MLFLVELLGGGPCFKQGCSSFDISGILVCLDVLSVSMKDLAGGCYTKVTSCLSPYLCDSCWFLVSLCVV